MSAPKKTARKRQLRTIKVVVPRPPSSFGLMKLQEVADELRIAKSSVGILVATGALKSIRPIPGGKCVRVFREDLLAYVARLRADNPGMRI